MTSLVVHFCSAPLVDVQRLCQGNGPSTLHWYVLSTPLTAVAANTHIMYASAWRRYASSWRRGAYSSGSRLDESCTRCIGDAASEPVILC